MTEFPHKNYGKLDLYIGPMLSGKSSTLIKKLALLSEMGFKVLYINHGIDNRSEYDYSTHSSLLKNRKLEFDTLKTTDFNLDIDTNMYDVIGIDEAQFFGIELILFVKKLVDINEKYVIVAGLDANFKREKFGYVLDLIPFADNVTKLNAYCKNCACDKEIRTAPFSHYTGNGTGTVIVGGTDVYQALCRKCYLEAQRSQKN